MTYLDANVFVYAATGEESKAVPSQKILQKVAEGNMDAYTSILTWDELVWAVKKKLGNDYAKEEGIKFLAFPKLKLISADAAVIAEAQRLVAEHKLDPRDAIHAASAIKNGIKDFVSDDPDFDKIKEIKRIKI